MLWLVGGIPPYINYAESAIGKLESSPLAYFFKESSLMICKFSHSPVPFDLPSHSINVFFFSFSPVGSTFLESVAKSDIPKTATTGPQIIRSNPTFGSHNKNKCHDDKMFSGPKTREWQRVDNCAVVLAPLNAFWLMEIWVSTSELGPPCCANDDFDLSRSVSLPHFMYYIAANWHIR